MRQGRSTSCSSCLPPPRPWGGGATLVAHHARNLAAGDGDSTGSIVLLLGMAAILVAGLRPGSSGSSDPAVLWLVAALLAPIAASVFALLFIFLLGRLPTRIRRCESARPR